MTVDRVDGEGAGKGCSGRGLTGRPSKIIRAAISGEERHSRSAIVLVIDESSVVEPTAATPSVSAKLRLRMARISSGMASMVRLPANSEKLVTSNPPRIQVDRHSLTVRRLFKTDTPR
ncbi:hypothetical protein AB6802_00935 [Mesorhizobium sp. RCC_202]|uniref:hypothetical protein n=1 Tax=Mesorhizobium sp. RCC_202 TaxID=3239222 RepID=UPI0035239317